jgi:glycosyltransferase involved in cell wall biosynthesis
MIAFLTTNPIANGGSENLWVEAAKDYAGNGQEIAAFVPDAWRESKHAQDLCIKGVKVEFFRNEVSFSRRVASRLLDGFPEWKRKVQSQGCLASHPFLMDAKLLVVNQGGLFDGSFVPGLPLLLERRNRPYILNVRSGRGLPGILPQWRRLEMRRIFEKAAGLILPTLANVQDIERELCWTPIKVHAIHSPVKNLHDEVPPWPSSHKLSFACACRYEVYEKGLDLVVEAARLLAMKSDNFSVTFYGKGPDVDYLADLIRFHGVEDKVKIAGAYQSLFQLWSQHHVYLAASRSEGLPQSLMEAMVAGRPAVVTPVGGMPDLIQIGQGGYVCDELSAEALAAAMEKCCIFADNLPSIGMMARETALKKLFNNPTNKFAEYLEELTGSEGGEGSRR